MQVMASSGPSSASTAWGALGRELPPLDLGFLPPNIGRSSLWRHSQLWHWMSRGCQLPLPGSPLWLTPVKPTDSQTLFFLPHANPSNGRGMDSPKTVPRTPKAWVVNRPILWFLAVDHGQISTEFTSLIIYWVPHMCQLQGSVMRTQSVCQGAETGMQWGLRAIWWVAAMRPWLTSAKVHPGRSAAGQDTGPVHADWLPAQWRDTEKAMW